MISILFIKFTQISTYVYFGLLKFIILFLYIKVRESDDIAGLIDNCCYLLLKKKRFSFQRDVHAYFLYWWPVRSHPCTQPTTCH